MSDELTPKPFGISKLPAKKTQNELGSPQLTLPLGVQKQAEIDGVGMGVLSDGTPFLTQRGLARLVDMENLHIRTISIEWDATPAKPRIEAIKKILWGRGQEFAAPHIEVKNGAQTMNAIPDAVCLAILEYYAFEAASPRPVALKNFRLLAGKALRDFIYAQVGYDPKDAVPEVWRQFHDRVSLTYNACPHGFFGVFKEISDMIVTLGQAGLHISADFVPDISVGRAWADHWEGSALTEQFGARRKYEHRYPDYFPQAASNPQEPWCYPDAALGEFRRWFRECYVGEGKFAKYLTAKVKQLALPPSFAQLALEAYKSESSDAES